MDKKKSFILYKDTASFFLDLTDEESGKLIKKIVAYQLGEDYESGDRIIDVLFGQFEKQFERDQEKYDAIVERNKENGRKGGRPKKPKETQNNPVGYSETQRNPKNPEKADNDNDNDNDNDSVNKYIKELQPRREVSKEVIESIDMFIQDRKDRKQKMTDRAIKMFIKKCLDYTNDTIIKLIEQSIERGRKSIAYDGQQVAPENLIRYKIREQFKKEQGDLSEYEDKKELALQYQKKYGKDGREEIRKISKALQHKINNGGTF